MASSRLKTAFSLLAVLAVTAQLNDPAITRRPSKMPILLCIMPKRPTPRSTRISTPLSVSCLIWSLTRGVKTCVSFMITRTATPRFFLETERRKIKDD